MACELLCVVRRGVRGRDTDLDSTACWLTADGDEDRSPSMWITCVGVHELVVREENEVTSIRIHPRDPSDIQLYFIRLYFRSNYFPQLELPKKVGPSQPEVGPSHSHPSLSTITRAKEKKSVLRL